MSLPAFDDMVHVIAAHSETPEHKNLFALVREVQDQVQEDSTVILDLVMFSIAWVRIKELLSAAASFPMRQDDDPSLLITNYDRVVEAWVGVQCFVLFYCPSSAPLSTAKANKVGSDFRHCKNYSPIGKDASKIIHSRLDPRSCSGCR
jgi:hypothetical protein